MSMSGFTNLLGRCTRFLCALFLAACTMPHAHATVRCVTDLNSLNTALDDANFIGAEGTTWDIRLQAKAYTLTGDFVFNPPGDKDNKTFYLSGGWNSNCTKQTQDASLTVLRGTASTVNAQGTQFTFDGDNAHVEISWLRFEQFGQWSISDKQCTLGNICPGTDAVIVEHNEFHQGESISTRIFDAKRFVVRGNLFDHIQELGHFNGPVDILIAANEDAQITFNTFADLKCLNVPGGIEFRTLNPGIAWHHNIMRSSCMYDAYLGSYVNAQPLNPWNNLYANLGPGFAGNPAAQGNVVATDPKFAIGSYHLQSTSPAVNAGQTLAGAVALGFQLSFTDLDGNARPFGLHYDIGAYESFVNDGAPQDWKVTNTSDADVAGSLRRAINNANAQVTGEQHIVFDIQTGTCPHVIAIQSPLPDIKHSVWIDGYSQPGSSKNGVQVGSTAKICVAIAPGAAGITHALGLPAGGPQAVQLVMDGLAFGGSFYAFTDSAVDLPSGNYHILTGNAFGGTLPSGGGALGTLPNAVHVHGGAVFVRVGGSDPGDRNYFGNLSGSAIRIDDGGPIDTVIENNYIGVTPDGLTAQQINTCGIEGYGGYETTVRDNAIVATLCSIRMWGASVQGWKVKGNRIGVSPYGSTQAQFRNAYGIYISSGAAGNYIGALPNEQLNVGQVSNDIRNNNTAGVLVTSNASVGNTIRGNRISADNGGGISLAGQSWGPNDAGDTDIGPNLLQNYPALKGSVPTGATRTITALLNSEPGQQYRIDFYRSATCTAGNSDADLYVGSADADSGATGTVRITAMISVAGAPEFLTATATSLSGGNTSVFAPCLNEDTIFRDGLDL